LNEPPVRLLSSFVPANEKPFPQGLEAQMNPKVKQAVVLCGGEGTRLHSVTNDEIPKPMVDLCGRPALEYQLELLRKHGATDVVLCTGHLGNRIEDYFGDGSKFDMQLRYTREKRRLGTAGALAQVPFALDDVFYILYGDVFVNVDLSRFARMHFQNHAAVTLFVHPSEHPYDSDLVSADPGTGRVLGFPGRPRPGDEFVNLTSAALYVATKQTVDFISRNESSDFVKNVFPAMLARGMALFAYETDEYVHDLGTVERYPKVESDVKRMMDERSGSLFGP
jgi:NDP-sugar pyrophosphorylase family protein